MTDEEVSILQSEDGLKTLFNYATLGILVVNRDHKICLANPFAEKLFGYSESEMQGELVELLIPNRFHQDHLEHRKKYKENSISRPMGLGLDLFGKKKDGSEFPLEISLATYVINNEKYIVAFINDVTSRKKAEDELKEYMQLLEERVQERTEHLLETLEKEKELNELKSRFVSMASHELRTPLTAILSSTNLAKRYTESDQIEQRHKHLDKIRSSVNTLVGILDNFLSLDKLENNKSGDEAEQINLVNLIEHVIDETRGLYKTNQEVVFIHEGQEDFVVDYRMLSHVLTNLLSNGIKYSEDNVLLSSSVHDGVLSITIKDKGIGIPKGEHDKMFELFFRAKNSGGIQGTGLGMNIVKKYVDLMDGDIKFESEEHIGTTFKLKIPEKNL